MDPPGNNVNRSDRGMDSGEGDARVMPNLPSMCSICHNEPTNAVQLNCGHIFCYLCIKSASETTGMCALCRCEIGIEFNSQEHDILGAARVPSSFKGYYWFYEGYKGWWLYDAETNNEIERAYERLPSGGPPILERFIAGSIYNIDVENMTQQRKDDDGRKRRICRETLELENILGMAGLQGRDFTELLDIMKAKPADFD